MLCFAICFTVNHPHQFSFIWRRNIPSDTNAEGIYKYKLMTKDQLITTTKDIRVRIWHQYTFFIHSFIHSGDLYSASSRDYYSEALPAQPRTKKKDFREM